MIWAHYISIHLECSSFDPFACVGQATPSWAQWLLDNKIYACMMTFFLFNGSLLSNFSCPFLVPFSSAAVETQLISTGAFEITLNDMPVRVTRLHSSNVLHHDFILKFSSFSGVVQDRGRQNSPAWGTFPNN